MLQDITPHIYHNAMIFAPAQPQDRALVCGPQGVLLREENGQIHLPRVGDLTGNFALTYAFSIDQGHYYLAPGAAAPGFAFRKDFLNMEPSHRVYACAVAQSLSRWYSANRFCGCCGSPMGHSQKERAMVCPECGQTVYPKICPAVIVAVCHGDRLLLTKYAGRAFTRYALVAGFNEIGETIEQTVAREVWEETGLRVRNLRFYKSQPWVVTDCLLMGFYADLVGSEDVRLQVEELSEGTWFHRENLPLDHSGTSLTGEMIEQFRLGLEPKGNKP